jgi:hypothetical protein
MTILFFGSMKKLDFSTFSSFSKGYYAVFFGCLRFASISLAADASFFPRKRGFLSGLFADPLF